jgi:hypothetical protein
VLSAVNRAVGQGLLAMPQRREAPRTMIA